MGWIVVAQAAAAGSSEGTQRAPAGDDEGIDEESNLDGLVLLPRRLERLRADNNGKDEDDDEANNERSQKTSFLRVLSWNTLADGLAQLGRFSRCPSTALRWPLRRELVLREIGRSGADVACLQEVNRPEELEPRLREAGYDGAFWAKPVSPAARLG